MTTTDGAGSVEVVAGDMLDWSDHAAGRPVPGGIVLEQLLSRSLPQADHALVVGPHDGALVDCVVSRAKTTTLLLRSHPDALAARERYPEANVRIVCGDIASFTTTAPADLLVALDGLERLVSVDVERLGWSAVHARLESFLTPGAAVFLMVENPLSPGELGAVPTAESTDDDASWWSLDAFDPSRPHGAEALTALVPGAVALTTHPSPHRPTLIAPCSRDRGVAAPDALLVAHNARSDSRIDPQVVTAKFLAAHRGEHLTSGWLVVRSAQMSAVSDVGLVADGLGEVARELRRDGQAYSLRVVGEPSGADRDRWVYSGASTTLAPEDPLLEMGLLRVCARRDLAGLRSTVAAFADHLRGLDEAGLCSWGAGTFDNVVRTTEGGFELLDPSWRLRAAPRPDDLAVELLDDFAGRLTTLGWRHPWPVATGRDELAVLLASAASIAVTAEEVCKHRDNRAVADLQRGRADRHPVEVSPDAHSLLLEENKGLHSQVAWFKRTLRQRDTLLSELRARAGQQKPKQVKRLRELELELTEIKQSRAYRTGRALAKPSGMIKRLARRSR